MAGTVQDAWVVVKILTHLYCFHLSSSAQLCHLELVLNYSPIVWDMLNQLSLAVLSSTLLSIQALQQYLLQPLLLLQFHQQLHLCQRIQLQSGILEPKVISITHLQVQAVKLTADTQILYQSVFLQHLTQ